MTTPPNTASSQPVRGGEPLERVRHKKRGTEYEVLGEAELQIALDRLLPNGREWSKALIEGDRVLIYKGDDGKMWAREVSEFRDGRFETIASAPSPDQAGAGADLGELERLNAKAALGVWRNGPRCIFAASTNPHIGGDDVVVSTAYSDRSLKDDDDNCAFIVALVNAYRSGHLLASTAGRDGEDQTGAWQPIETAPTNVAVQVYCPRHDYYGNQGVYAGMLVDMGTGQRWMTFAWAMGRDMIGDVRPTHWRYLPEPPETPDEAALRTLQDAGEAR